MILLRTKLLLGVVFSYSIFACAPPKPEAEKLPNIILINVDDVGYGDFEPYGQKLIKTPRISQMAREGAMFSNFYSGSTVCGPSRAALLSGFHIGHQYSCGNGQGNLAQNFRTWPHFLKDKGYRTAMFGKQHNAQLKDSIVLGDSPLDRGFEEFVGHLNAVDAHQYFFDGKTDGWKRRKYLFKSQADDSILPHHIGPDRYTQNEFMDHATTYIREHQEEAFFLYLPFTIAHAELAIP
ncbi:MAG: sulfatase-like hydrolase/transferase, partial [Bacteroidota bacterium]